MPLSDLVDTSYQLIEKLQAHKGLVTGVPSGFADLDDMTSGFQNAFATIFDSNITTLIAGVALLSFGSGPVRGFAVVHCLGILTSMFSAVFFSRGLVNLWYGRQKKLKSVSIGTVWRPEGGQGSGT